MTIRGRHTLCASLVAAVLPWNVGAQPPIATPSMIPPPPSEQPTPAIVTPRPSQTRADRKTVNRIVPQGFSVALVLGDFQATAPAQDDVPAAARKALTDMKDFLPYKSYKLLDAAWMLCCSGSRVINRLRGLDEQEYELEISASPADSGRTHVRFVLRDAAAADAAFEAITYVNRKEETQATRRQIEQLQAQLAERRARSSRDASVKQLEDRLARLKDRLTAREKAEADLDRVQSTHGLTPTQVVARTRSRAIIDTSFTMDVGETVVVGTSRLKGKSNALIALLTAVPPKGGAAREE